MKDLKHNFITWYFNWFQQSPMFIAMNNTVEGSSWHRENSVGIHTHMVVSHFITNVSPGKPWDRDDVARALSCAFHDVGKPAAKISKHNEIRGDYVSFPGHEQKSARLWEDYAVSNWESLQQLFNLRPHHIYKIGWMIEYHKPWDIKKPHKLEKMARTISEISWPDSFGEVLLADALGRIQDDRKDNIAQAENWIKAMIEMTEQLSMEREQSLNDDMPTLCMLIGPSGAGKSTWIANNVPDYEHYSWDALRHDWYDPDDYGRAYSMSCDYSTFMSRAQAEFMTIIKAGKSLVVDNTNLGNKRRRFYVVEAIKRGYKLQAVLFPISSSMAVNRQGSRGDKKVPMDAVIRQYMSMQYPSYGDYDEIVVCGDNLSA